ncbi:hypothetical protein [Empedobacter falsenii]
MKVYDKNKVLEVSRALFYEKYPDADCFVLTGSQLEEEFVSIVSDIDILIIDSNLSGVSSEGMFYKGYKIDFTRVGLYSLNEVLIDSCYSNTNTILNMIIKGVFIEDKHSLELTLKEYCRKLYNIDSINYFSEFKEIRRSLVKLQKNFSKELKDYQIPLTLSDFLLNISKAYLFFNNNGRYGFDGFRRSKLLSNSEAGKSFLNSINELTKNYLIDNDNKFILAKLDTFLDYSLLNTKKINDFRYILNIYFKSNNSYLFYKKLIKGILENEVLNTYFIYGQRVSKNSVFKYEYILVFKQGNESLIIKKLIDLINELKLISFKYTSVDAFYISEIWQNENLINIHDNILNNINKGALELLVEEKKFNYKKLIPLFIYTIEVFRLSNNMSQDYINDILFYLRKKHRNHIYFQDVKKVNIEVNNKAIDDIDRFFLKENKVILDVFLEQIESSKYLESIEIELSSALDIRKSINELDLSIKEYKIVPDFQKTLLSSLKYKNSNEFYIYANLLDSILKAFCLKENHYSMFLVFSKNIYDNAKFS